MKVFLSSQLVLTKVAVLFSFFLLCKLYTQT